VKQYRADMKRMLNTGGGTPEQIAANNRRSFGHYRAALVFHILEMVRGEYARLWKPDEAMPIAAANEAVDIIERGLAVLRYYPPHGDGAAGRWVKPKKGQTRKGKRRGLSKLPPEWRSMMVEACPPGSEYAGSLLLSALFGLRPAELRRGAVVVLVDGRYLGVKIAGAKVTATTGQPWRKLVVPADNPVAKRLAGMVESQGEAGRLVVSIVDPRKYCDFVRALSRRTFPKAGYVASPYSFRHAFAADQKAQGLPVEDLAQALGHVSGRSQRSYGSAGQGRSPLVTKLGTQAARPVRALDRGYGYTPPRGGDQAPSSGTGPVPG
jgi:integrase